jgi:hypothetical protein
MSTNPVDANIKQNMNIPPIAPTASMLAAQQNTNKNTAALYMNAAATNPPPTNAALGGPDMNSKAANVYKDIQSGIGRVNIGNDSNVLKQINDFLSVYPQRNIRKTSDGKITPNTWIDMSLREVFQQTIQVTIDIINDISNLISDKPFMNDTDFRRKMFDIFAREDRRIYVGILLIFLSFVLYFIDSAT